MRLSSFSRPSAAARAYALLFFLSGATGLVYELLWVRVLYQAFGSTIQSVTTVVTAYMGGLGLGAWLFGRRADRHPRPAALYGVLEIAIAAFGLISPLVLGVAHRLYLGIAGSLPLGEAASVALRFGLAALVLLVPTTLMGGTLPVLTGAFMGADRGQLKCWGWAPSPSLARWARWLDRRPRGLPPPPPRHDGSATSPSRCSPSPLSLRCSMRLRGPECW